MKFVYFIFIIFLGYSVNVSAKKRIKLPKNFVYISANTLEVEGAKVAIPAFYMQQSEVTNAEYKSFLDDLRADGKDSLYNIAYPDTMAWLVHAGYLEPMANLYFRHLAYANYPMVNMSAEGASLYCAWLAEKWKEEFNTPFIQNVQLPSHNQWVLAAKGGMSTAKYAWRGNYLRNSEGNFLANFKVIGDENIRKTDTGYEIVSDSLSNLITNYFTSPTASYNPNGYGLYNMCGNVSELTAENIAVGGNWNSTGYDIQVTSEMDFESANPYVGFRPIFTLPTVKK